MFIYVYPWLEVSFSSDTKILAGGDLRLDDHRVDTPAVRGAVQTRVAIGPVYYIVLMLLSGATSGGPVHCCARHRRSFW